MAVYNLGRICPVFRGNFLLVRSYQKLDVVLWQGSSYVALQDCQGKIPSQYPDYWQVVASSATYSSFTDEEKEQVASDILAQISATGTLELNSLTVDGMNVSAQITDLTNWYTSLSGDLTNTTETAENALTKTEDVEATVGGLETNVEANSAEIQALLGRVAELERKVEQLTK